MDNVVRKALSIGALVLSLETLTITSMMGIKADAVEVVTPIDYEESANVIDEAEPQHTRVEEIMNTDDTEEQINEEIRLGEIEVLAQLVHAEAGNQDLYGKRLVADVVLNRVADGWADGTVEGVIFQTLSNGVAQFSTTTDGAYNNAGWEMTESDYEAARIEYEATQRLDEALFYFRAGKWSDYGMPAYKHGAHYFSYK